MMPHVHGLGVLAHIIETAPRMIEKTIIMTVFQEAAARARVHHLCRLLPKPFDVEKFVSMVRACTEVS